MAHNVRKGLKTHPVASRTYRISAVLHPTMNWITRTQKTLTNSTSYTEMWKVCPGLHILLLYH